MLIIGNSHLSIFKDGLECREKGPVEVRWVGAVKINWFEENHPGAEKIMEMLPENPGPRLLMLGIHDLIEVVNQPGREARVNALSHKVGRYSKVFAKLKTSASFCWLLGTHQTAPFIHSDCSPEEAKTLADRFVKEISAWCGTHGIPVINPLPKFSDDLGNIKPVFLQKDGVHIKSEFASLYAEAINEILGTKLFPAPAGGASPAVQFDTSEEQASFCDLITRELDLPAAIPHQMRFPSGSLSQKIKKALEQRLDARGLGMVLNPDDDFVNNGLMDSLDLVEIYGQIHKVLGREINFDVNLRELNTIHKLSAFLAEGSGTPVQPPVPLYREDFAVSFCLDFSQPEEQGIIQASENRIAAAGPEIRARFESLLKIAGAEQGPYGFPLFWLGLMHSHMPDRCQSLMSRSGAAAMPFPVPIQRILHYLQPATYDLSAPQDDRQTNPEEDLNPDFIIFPETIAYEDLSGNIQHEPRERFNFLDTWPNTKKQLFLMLESGRPDQARLKIHRLLETDPENIDALIMAVRIDLKLKDFLSAEHRLTALQALWPFSSEAFTLLARMHASNGDSSQADAAVRQALKLDPLNQEALAMALELHQSAAGTAAPGDVPDIQANQDTPSPKKDENMLEHPENKALWWTAGKSVSSEDDLLGEIGKRVPDLARTIKHIYIIGAHEFQEHALLKREFTSIQKIYLFEPIPPLFEKLKQTASRHPYLEAFPYAIGEFDGPTQFNITDNLASSSLLHFGKHLEMFPHVKEMGAIPVECRKLSTVIRQHHLEPPDMLFIDVQGAEYMVLSAIPPEIISNVTFIYTEASTTEVYKGSRPLSDLQELLHPWFHFLGFAPLTNRVTEHGNALFLNKSAVQAPIAPQENGDRAADMNAEAESLFSAGKIEEAEELLKKALLLNPQSDVILNNLGVIHWQKKNLTAARHFFQRALEKNPGNENARLNLQDLS